jgi:glucokinase
MLVNAAGMKPTSNERAQWLIADIGATTSRCAILAAYATVPDQVRIYRNDEFPSLEALLGDYLKRVDERPQSVALAVAAPVHDDNISMMNRNWSWSGATLALGLGVGQVKMINDFHAIAYALPTFDESTRSEIGTATEYREGSRAALGPGSGLGASAWIAGKSGGATMTGEGGHVTLAGRNKAEDEIIAEVRARFGHASAERILSGPGLIVLHDIMHGIRSDSSEAITGNPQDAACAATMNQFFSFLGSVAGDLALFTGCFGGMYIAGGIVPACLEQIAASPFRERFEAKNRYREYMQRIPTYVITDPLPGLSGLVAMLSAGSGRPLRP